MMSHEQFERFNTNPIRYVHTVGQILTHGVVKSAYKRFPNLKLFVNNYGMTEILRASFNPIRKFHSDDDDKENNDGEVYGDYSLGRALPFIEMTVIDVKSGALVPFGKTGELCVRGFSTLNFYWNEDDTNHGIDCNGW
jgi:fatty-acyl-CoA synthase